MNLRLTLIIFIISTLSFGQEIVGNIPNTQIHETIDGYFVYGIHKGLFSGDFYTKDFEKSGSISQVTNKKSRYVVLSEYENDLIHLSTRHNKMVVNSKTATIESFEPFDARNEAYGPSNMNNYIPYPTVGMIWGMKNSINHHGNYFELFKIVRVEL